MKIIVKRKEWGSTVQTGYSSKGGWMTWQLVNFLNRLRLQTGVYDLDTRTGKLRKEDE